MPPSKIIFCSFLIFFTSILIAQNSFQKGSYIDKKGNKNEGFIYNLDWQYSPTEIKFKNTADDEAKQITIDDIREFEVDGCCKYVKYEGLIDDSSAIHAELGFNRNPNWKTVNVLLKVLVDSDASLFFYNCEDYSRFLYSVKSKGLKIQQLVYKEYYLDGGKTEIGTNFQFRQQLANDFDCGSMQNGLPTIKYNRKDLEKYFLEYNKCKGAVIDTAKITEKKKKIKVNYSLLVGFSTVDFGILSDKLSVEKALHQFDMMYSYPVGAEVELVLPMNNNKWSLYFQPSFQSFSASETTQGTYWDFLYEIDYKSINLPIGLRHYIFLNNKKSKIYLNGAFSFNVDTGSTLTLQEKGHEYGFYTTAMGINLGVAYVLNDRYAVELRYTYSSDLINSMAFTSDYSGFGLLFKYQLNK